MQASLRLRSLDGRCRGNPVHILDVSSKNFRHAPGLGYTAARQLRGVAVEDLRDVSEPTVTEMLSQRRQPFARLATGGFTSTVHLDVCADEGSEQPRPYGSLMISTVALSGTTSISPAVLRIGGRQATQTIRRKQMLLNFLHHALRPFG